MLPKQAIIEFQDIYFRDTGKLLTMEQATAEAYALFNGLAVIFNVDRQEGKEEQ